MEALKSVSPELIKAGLADSELVVNIFKAKNMNDLERYITRSMKSKKLENNQLMQLQQRIQQYEAQIQENQRQLEQLSSENKKLLNQIDKNSKEKFVFYKSENHNVDATNGNDEIIVEEKGKKKKAREKIQK